MLQMLGPEEKTKKNICIYRSVIVDRKLQGTFENLFNAFLTSRHLPASRCSSLRGLLKPQNNNILESNCFANKLLNNLTKCLTKFMN